MLKKILYLQSLILFLQADMKKIVVVMMSIITYIGNFIFTKRIGNIFFF